MRHCICLLLAIALFGCGPLPESGSTLDLIIENQYAESNFTVSYAAAGQAQTPVCTNAPVKAWESRTFPDAIVLPADAESVTVYLTALSLGEQQRFDPLQIAVSGSAPIHLTYDYNLATATFRVSYGQHY